MTKILNSKTERKRTPAPEPEAFSLISNEKLLAIYSAMLKCRMLQQRATSLFQQGKLASDLHASYGREASDVAIAIELQPRDALNLSPGDWLPAFVKGLALETLFRLLAPAALRLNDQQLAAPADLEQRSILAGNEAHRPDTVRERAVAAQAAKEGAIVASILPSEPDSWHRVMAAAASEKLPILFVHHVDSAHQPAGPPSIRKSKNPDTLVHGVPAIAVDALDAVAVYRVAYEAIVRARQGRGATLLECASHSAPSHQANPQGPEPSAHPALATDPVASMENYLKRKGIEPEQHNHQIVAAFNSDLELATRFLDQ